MSVTLDDFEAVMAQQLDEASDGIIRLEDKKGELTSYFMFTIAPADLAKAIRNTFELTVMKELAKDLGGTV